MSREKKKNLPQTGYKVNEKLKSEVLIELEKTKQLSEAHRHKARWQWWIAALLGVSLVLIIWDRLDPGFEVPAIQGVPAHWLAFIILNLAMSGISIGSLIMKK